MICEECKSSKIVVNQGFYVCQECGRTICTVMVVHHPRREAFHYGVDLGSDFFPNSREFKYLRKVNETNHARSRKSKFVILLRLASTHFNFSDQFQEFVISRYRGKGSVKKELFESILEAAKDLNFYVNLGELKEFLGLRAKVSYRYSLSRYESFFNRFPPSLLLRARTIFFEKIKTFTGSPKTLIASIYYQIVPGASKKSTKDLFQVSYIRDL